MEDKSFSEILDDSFNGIVCDSEFMEYREKALTEKADYLESLGISEEEKELLVIQFYALGKAIIEHSIKNNIV